MIDRPLGFYRAVRGKSCYYFGNRGLHITGNQLHIQIGAVANQLSEGAPDYEAERPGEGRFFELG